VIHDRPSHDADGRVPPRPVGLGLFDMLASLFSPHRPLRVCSSFTPCHPVKLPPAKTEFIFAETLRAPRVTYPLDTLRDVMNNPGVY
jgi:hypothetical protein